MMEPEVEGASHPLETQTVLREICRNLKFEDLKTLREVSRAFRIGADTALCNSVIIRMNNVDGKRLVDFMKIVELEVDGVGAYQVPAFMRDFIISSEKRDDIRFWEIFGSSIKSLRLDGVTFESRDSFRNAIFRSCPNLVTLEMSDVRVNQPTPEDPTCLYKYNPLFPQNLNLKDLKIRSADMGAHSWMEYLCQFPCVEKFDGWHIGCWGGFFNSLAIARQMDPELGRITDLKFDIGDMEDPSAALQALEDSSLPLENLHVGHIDRPEDRDVLRKIFTAHSDTLKKFELIGAAHGSSIEGLFPLPDEATLPNVEKVWLSLVSLHSPIFLRGLPNLKELDLTCVQPTATFEQFAFGEWKLASCKTLRIFLSYFSPPALRQLFCRLPNVQKLYTLQCDNKKFEVICELLSNLEYLSLAHCWLDDVGISGMEAGHVLWNNFNEEIKVVSRVTKPNLTDLKKLKSLSWTDISDRSFVDVRIPGYVAYICVQQLPELCHLRVPMECTQPFWNELRSKFPWKDPKRCWI